MRHFEPNAGGISGCENSNIKFACCECGAISATEFVRCENQGNHTNFTGEVLSTREKEVMAVS